VTVGFDAEAQQDDRRRYDNLQGARGPLTLQQEEQAESVGVFVHDALSLSDDWLAELGLRYDNVRLAVDDEFLTDGDDSGSRRLTDWNWSAGLSYRLDSRHRLYGQLATSFETPTINELANPAGGGFNPGLDPAKAFNRELGLKAEWPHLRYEVANLRVGYRREAGGLVWEPYAGINNLFDKEYFGNIRTNATFGRYFEPAPERHLYAGLRVAY
jgi:iron complex outermembrane receptor protein